MSRGPTNSVVTILGFEGWQDISVSEVSKDADDAAAANVDTNVDVEQDIDVSDNFVFEQWRYSQYFYFILWLMGT